MPYIFEEDTMNEDLFNNDLRYKSNGRLFSYRVGAIIIENGHVLLASNDVSPYYYSVGGAVKHCETAEKAIKREVFEETGVDYDIDRLVVIHETFFSGDGSVDGYKCHEICLYFLMRSRGTMEIDCHSFCSEGKEYMCWIPINKLKDVTAYPTFLSELLEEMPKEIIHIVNDEINA